MRLSEIGSTSRIPRLFMMLVSCLCALRIFVMVMEEVQALPAVTLVKWHAPGELSSKWLDTLWRKKERLPENRLVAGGQLEREAPAHESVCLVEGNYRPALLEFVTQSCLHSKQLDVNVLRGREISDLINAQFYPLRIEFDDGQRHSPATAMLIKYRVAQVPTLIVTNERGEEISRLTGYKSGTTVYRFLTSALLSKRSQDEAARRQARQN